MTPQEQEMIGDLIDRVQKTQLTEKDMDAEQMLQQGLGKNPDALYILSQTVLVQKYAFELAQAFNNFYHKHHILSEADAQKRGFLLALTERVEAQLMRTLELMGIAAPEKM